jgi:glutaredoxin
MVGGLTTCVVGGEFAMSIFSWGRGGTGKSTRVVMYTRPGCHLCADAWQMLTDMRVRFRLDLESINVDVDPELKARHGERVPVVVINGTERCWGRINRVLLERQLQAEMRRSQ